MGLKCGKEEPLCQGNVFCGHHVTLPNLGSAKCLKTRRWNILDPWSLCFQRCCLRQASISLDLSKTFPAAPALRPCGLCLVRVPQLRA